MRGIYDALEAAVRVHRQDRLVAAVYDPALERIAALDAGLQHWALHLGPELNSRAVQRFRGRLSGLSWGGALVAHHCTRYLGDLSGGQAMAGILGREFDLGQRAGVLPLRFPDEAVQGRLAANDWTPRLGHR